MGDAATSATDGQHCLFVLRITNYERCTRYICIFVLGLWLRYSSTAVIIFISWTFDIRVQILPFSVVVLTYRTPRTNRLPSAAAAVVCVCVSVYDGMVWL